MISQVSTRPVLFTDAIRDCKSGIVGVALISALVNVLYLTGSLYMLEVYDRVLPSQSIPTLVGLSAIALLLYIFQWIFDLIRARILVRIGTVLDERVAGRVFEMLVRLPLLLGGKADGIQPVRSLDMIRGFFSGPGPLAFFDLPWMPFYLFFCFSFHPLLGWTATSGALLLLVVTVASEILSRKHLIAIQSLAAKRQVLSESAGRNAEVLGSMGMVRRIRAIWAERNGEFVAKSQAMSDLVGGLGTLSRVLRTIVQSAVLGVGGYLVIRQEATAGIIIAGSILAARALAPVEQVVANWRAFASARQGWMRLRDAFALLPRAADPLLLRAPKESLSIEALVVTPPGASKSSVFDLSFRLKAGDGLAIVGASASGKSSLARALAGVWTPTRGKIRLDLAALDQWSPDSLGSHIGYLPQSVELLAGTVAQNIARFDRAVLPSAIVAAAEAAGVHAMILRLPDGYETDVGEDGNALSAGQRQRIALARALFGEPFLVVLDEPNSNLDAEGEAALTEALFGIRRRGGIVVAVAHRPSVLAALDTVLVMHDGRAQAFGPRDEVMKRVPRGASPALVEPFRVA